MSFAGGQIISIAALLCLAIEGSLWIHGTLSAADRQVLSRLLVLGGAAGFLGSLVGSYLNLWISVDSSRAQLDSLLGAVLQATLYHKQRRMVVHSRISPITGKIDPEVVNIGGPAVLSNNGVGS